MKIIRYMIYSVLLIAGMELLAFMFLPYAVFDNEIEVPDSDCAIVLFNTWEKVDGHIIRIDYETRRRLDFTDKLYREGRIDKIICAGGSREETDMPHNTNAMSKYLINKGVPEEDVYYELTSYDTITNISESIKIMEREDLVTGVVIASSFHVKRAAVLFRSAFGKKETPVRLNFIPYRLKEAEPRPGRFFLLKDFQYNKAAYLYRLFLPERLYRVLTLWIRHRQAADIIEGVNVISIDAGLYWERSDDGRAWIFHSPVNGDSGIREIYSGSG